MNVPWMVVLTDDKGWQFCGGTLVTPTKVVVIAAHCTLEPATGSPRSPEELCTVAGGTDLRTHEGMVGEVERV